MIFLSPRLFISSLQYYIHTSKPILSKEKLTPSSNFSNIYLKKLVILSCCNKHEITIDIFVPVSVYNQAEHSKRASDRLGRGWELFGGYTGSSYLRNNDLLFPTYLCKIKACSFIKLVQNWLFRRTSGEEGFSDLPSPPVFSQELIFVSNRFSCSSRASSWQNWTYLRPRPKRCSPQLSNSPIWSRLKKLAMLIQIRALNYYRENLQRRLILDVQKVRSLLLILSQLTQELAVTLRWACQSRRLIGRKGKMGVNCWKQENA